MVATDTAERKIVSVDDLFDVARAIADDSADPGATYESFLRGLEMGLTYNTLDPVLSKAIGNKLADLRPVTQQEIEPEPANERTIGGPARKNRRTVIRPITATGSDFPTEWTLEP